MSHRICVFGNTGSGKSTISKAIGKELDIPVIHLDRELLYDDFKKHPIEKKMEIQQKIIEQDSWVMDGNYMNIAGERVKRSSLVIFLNVSRLISVPRVLLRSKRGGHDQDTVPDGARKKVSLQLLKCSIGYNRRKKVQYMYNIAKEYGTDLLLIPSCSTEKQVQIVKNHLNKTKKEADQN